MRLSIAIAVLTMSFGFGAEEKPKTPESVDELKEQLEKILKDTHTPGMSVAIAHRSGPEWVAGLGTADVATARAATADTLFRIGSVSKAFASFSILLLAREGKLSLDDPVSKLAPEVYFENRWEATDPVLVVHLLEHTTGWDDLHLREFAWQAPGVSLQDALDFDHTSRVSRWKPGTRVAYCNSGPAVAAFIVEKISGQRFEDFVQTRLFDPIGMKTATYFPPAANVPATTLYHEDGKTPYPYWHIIYRPSGSMNASAKDMAAYLQFYLNRGKVGGRQVVAAADMDRAETPTSGWAAKEGLKNGYGLSNAWNVADGFVYHGHDGGVDGGITQMWYLPEYDVGYFFSVNTGNNDTVVRADIAIRSYITRKLEKPPVPEAAPLPAGTPLYEGWYELDSPRMQMGYFFERLLDTGYVGFTRNRMWFRHLGAWNDTYAAVTGEQFRFVSKVAPPNPVASVVLGPRNREGQFIHFGMATMKRIPGWQALLEILLSAFVLLSFVSILAYAPFWILGGLIRNRRRPEEREIRIWPLVAVLCLLGCFVIGAVSDEVALERFGRATPWSIAFSLGTVGFAVAALGSAIASWTASSSVRPWVRRYSIAVTTALLIATVYLGYWGVIGIRTWA